MSTKNVFTIPAGVPFARALADRLLKETEATPEKLSEYRILLPTRRACTTVRDAFLSLSDAPLLLPRLQPLGDIDEEELSLSIAGDENMEEILNLPPAISPLRRQALLARAVMKIGEFHAGFDQALALAAALGRFMDQVYTEGRDLADLANLAPEEFSDHWQITVEFLKILSENWPAILKENGVIDSADRRDRLIRALAAFWSRKPPEYPVIAAGSTGSIPATAELLKIISIMPQGRVVLPGLDQNMDEESWNAIEDSHPQAGLKKLLDENHLNIDPKDVNLWPIENDETSARRALLTELMRPSKTSGAWTHLSTNAAAKKTFAEGIQSLKIFECANEREESGTIAVLLREALQTEKKTVALVTPDRALARRVAAACRRWNINIDDSGGQTLDQSPVGCFLRLALDAAAKNFSPVALLSLLKHKHSAAGMKRADFRRGVEELEINCLRGPSPPPGVEGLFEKLDEKGDDHARNILNALAPIFKNFMTSAGSGDFKTLLKSHIEMAESLASRPGVKGAETLWSGDDGEAAAAFFADLFDHTGPMPPASLPEYAAALSVLMRTVTVRPAYGSHPRLMILGQLEARLIDADLIILGGLNEGTWPQDAGHDPWMSRPMRKEFGLPAHERGIGLSAHDFAEGFCAREAIITRALRVSGAPTVPSRWLQRLDTVLTAAGLDKDSLREGKQRGWASALDHAETVTPQKRPAPKPPLNKRPRSISASKVETWLKDPYGIYARAILRLEKLDPPEKAPDARDKGNLLHEILERFTKECPKEIPPNAEDTLLRLAEEELAKRHEDPLVWSFWKPRFAKIATWLVNHEKEWRRSASFLCAEAEGKITMDAPGGPFTIKATLDRIDQTPDGAAIIDYKSGGTFSREGIDNGKHPQLSVEGLILKHGGFPGITERKTAGLYYWLMTGGSEPGKITSGKEDANDVISRTEEGLKNLIAAFDDENTPYYSLPRPDNKPRFNDYEHLARVNEWSALGGEDSEAA